eukprot:SAG31_NODE_7862_length_1581_cov_1.124831_1_plen_134_part_00
MCALCLRVYWQSYECFQSVRTETLLYLQRELGASLTCVEVLHPGCAYAAIWEGIGEQPLSTQPDGKFKLVYSGDTRPCQVYPPAQISVRTSNVADLGTSGQALVRAGIGATILIHEATMENELGDDAVFKQCA